MVMGKNIASAKKNYIYIFLWIIISFFYSFNIRAAEIIDIDKFQFPGTGQKGIRLVSFDIKYQKYHKIHYFIQPTVDTSNFQLLGINFDSECNVNIPDNFPLKDYTITTKKGVMKINERDASEKAVKATEAGASDRCVIGIVDDFDDKGNKFNRTVLSYKKISIRPGSYIMENLNKTSGKSRMGGDFYAFFHTKENPEPKLFNNLSSDKKSNNTERSILGELATKLTMIGFGYNRLSSKYGTDNGFDGVFRDSSNNPELFISESKCQDRADGTKTIMKDNLSEMKINYKLNRIINYNHPTLKDDEKEFLEETGRIIQSYIEEEPDNIFKFAHRLKPDGTCECLVNKFDAKNYEAILLSSLTPQSPDKDKISVLKTITSQISFSEEQKVEILLSCIKSPSKEEKLRLIFTALKIESEAQDEMIKHLPRPKAQKGLFVKEKGKGKEKEKEKEKEKDTELDTDE